MNVIEQAFEEHKEMLLRIANAYVRNAATAEDILQDVLMATVARDPDLTLKSAKHYLIASVRNRSIGYLTSAKHRMQQSSDEEGLLNIASMAPHQDRVLEDKEMVRICMEAIDLIPPKCREVMVLRKIDGLSLKETALQLGVSTSTVKNQLNKALRHCANHLAEKGYTSFSRRR